MQRSFAEYPSKGVSLRVFVNGTQVEDDPVFNRTWNRSEIIRFCQGTPYIEHFYTTADTLEVGTVVTGDTLDFLFVTDRGNYGDDPLEGAVTARTDGRFDVDLYHFDTFCNQFADRLTVIAEIAGCPVSGLNPLCSPVATFIRQDNTAVPETGDDATLMVSKYVTDINLPSTATFEGPPGSTPDPNTYRVEARGIEAGQNVSFQLGVTRDGSPEELYAYAAVEGEVIEGGDTLVVYRMNKHVRFVSNARPDTGAAGEYDEDVNDPSPDPAPNPTDDQTIRVALNDSLRGIVLLDGSPIYDVGLPVGRPATEDGPNAVRTADLRFVVLAGQTANPAEMTARASEDWAQAGIRFSNTHVNSSAVPVNNGLLFSTSHPVEDGILRVRVVRPDSAGANGIAEVSYSAGESSRVIAARLSTEISDIVWQNSNPFAAQSFDYGNVFAIAMTNFGASEDIRYKVLDNTDPDFAVGAIIQDWVDEVISAQAAEMLGINYGDYDMSTIDVFVVPELIMDTGVGAQAKPEEYAARNGTTINGLKGQINTIIIRSSQSMANDAIRPYAFGHELGHILLDGRFPGSDNNGHILGDSTIVMYSPTTEPEGVQGSKRVNTIMPGVIRTESGINATPAILHRGTTLRPISKRRFRS